MSSSRSPATYRNRTSSQVQMRKGEDFQRREFYTEEESPYAKRYV